MRQKNRILVTALTIIGALIALDAILVIAAAQTATNVGSATAAIEKFRECVNKKIEEKKNTGGIDISDTVACLPGSCTVTATMSEDSSQKACFSGGTEKCQLPRVFVTCPESSESPQIEFSYLLCGTGSVTGGEIGSNRVEIGAGAGEINGKKVMVMADVPVPPGTTAEIKDVISLFPPGPNKGCNADGCHEGRRSGTETARLSERIEVFGTSDKPMEARNPSFIIFTDDCEVADKVKDIPLNGGLTKVEKFSEICDCIDMLPEGGYDTKNAAGTVTGRVTAAQAAVMKKLCRALEKYQHHTPWPTDCTPTVITLASFDAKAGNNGRVVLTWETVAEVDNAGFNLYRARVKDGRYKKINTNPIPARSNDTSGATYRYVDKPRKGTYYYKLEDVDYYGVSTLHGPEKVRVKSGNNTSHRSKKARR